MSSDDKKVLLKLRDIRRLKGMSLNSLAEKTGIDYQRVGRIERGETQMTIDLLGRIAKGLQVPLAQLLEEEDINGLQNKMAKENSKEPPIFLIPSIYDKLELFCKKYNYEIDNSVKVHLATHIFKCIQDIRINVKDDEDMVKVLFQLFDAIFERIVMIEDDAQIDKT